MYISSHSFLEIQCDSTFGAITASSLFVYDTKSLAHASLDRKIRVVILLKEELLPQSEVKSVLEQVCTLLHSSFIQLSKRATWHSRQIV